MERGREGRRSGGPVSAPRRPRTTGFKDSPVREEEEVAEEAHNSRLRERGKKEKESLPSGSGLRNKRKRQEVQPAADEAEDSTDETDAAGSDDDDDAPPPIPRWSGKSRQGKFAEEGIGLDLPAVPRKARSAIVKRHQEASQPVSQAPQHSSPSTPAPSSHNNGSSTPSSSAAAANKPGRRLKPNGSKARPAKIPKSSPAPISEQEVEVAEALFDLSRMAPSQAKPDNRTENTQALSPPSASPISNAPAGSHSAEAPRRKRPRIRPREEPAGARPATTVASASVPQRLAEHDRNSSVERTMAKLEATTAKPSIASLQPPSATGQEHASELHAAQMSKPEGGPPDMATERRGEPPNPAMDSIRRKPDARPVKFEIDLMAPPSGNDGLDCSTDVHSQHQELPWAEKERERLKEKDGKDKEENFVKTEDAEKLDFAERECLDLNKHGMGSQRMSKSSRVDAKPTQKPDRSVSAAVVSAASSFLNASTSSSSTTPSPMSMTSWPGALPSVGYYGHAAAAVAAAAAAGGWPQTAASTGSLAGAEENNASHPQVIPYLSGRHSWKRCAIHVFIARFIDVQQQMARHSLMAATYTAYGGKPYNLNIPADGVFGSGNTMCGATSDSNVTAPLGGERSLFSNGHGQKNSSFVDALYRKHPVQQQQSQKQQQQQPQPPQPQLQAVQGPGPAFGFPVGASSGSNGAGSTGASAGTSASSVPAGPSNAASMAAQAQLFQAVLQHNPFSFPFPASHFGNHNFNGGQNIGQQGAQFVNNPFYASHLAQSQQQGQPAGVLGGTSQKSGGGRVLPSIGQQQFSSQQGLAGSALQSEKEGGSNREVAADNKLHRLVFGQNGQQASNGAAPNLNMLKDGCQDFSGLPGKLVSKPPVLQQQASAGVPPSTTATGQHGGTSTLQMSIKNLDSQSSQVSSSVCTTRSSVGPGPLGLAPVAPVMAPQGHVVLQGMADQANQARLQTHLHSLQSGQPRSLQQQQPQKMAGDDMEGSKSYQDDRKLLTTKRASRVDLDALPSMQGSPTSSSSRMASNGAAASLLPTGPQARLNVLSSSHAAPSLQPCSQSVKQGAAVRTKSPAPPFVDRAGATSRVTGQAMPFPASSGMQGSKNGPGQQISHPAQLKIGQRPAAAPAVGGPALLGSSMGKNHQRMPPGNPGPSPPSSMPLAQGPKPGSTPQKNAVAKGGPLTLSQKPTATAAVAAATSGKRSPAGMSPSSSGGQNHQSASRSVAQQHQQQQQVSSPQQQATSPQQQYSAHSVNQQQQQQQQTVNHLQPKSFSQMRLQYLPQQQLPHQGPAMSPSANGLSLSSTAQGPSLASNSNGTRDNMSSSGSSTSSRPASASSPATSVGTQRGANSGGMPLLHQTGSPGCYQQTSNVPVSGYPNGGGPTVKSSASEQKMESETLSGGIRSPSSPMKTANMTLGRAQQQQQQQHLSARVAQSSSSPMPAASNSSEVRVNIMTPAGAAQQAQPPLPAAQPAPASTSAHLVPIAVSASGGAPGLLGQSSASALRP